VNRHEYYEKLKARARDVRAQYGLDSPRVLRSHLRGIYRDQEIRIDPWPHKLKGLRGAYFNDDLGATVMVAKLPPEPTIFTLAHELKHHLFDCGIALSYCGLSNETEPIEIGAEIFAAELIFPEEDFVREMNKLGIAKGKCTSSSLVQLKHETQTTLSYMGLVKRAEFLGFAFSGSLPKTGWKKIEEQLYGEPFYKQLLRRRRAKLG